MRKKPNGFSLMEMVISVAIIGIFFTSVTLVYFKLGKGILINRTRTVAANLAQEKIEFLKNVPYSRLSATTMSDMLSYGYDNTYYPPEKGVLVGDISYERRVLIQRAVENASGDLVEALPDAGDTGIKKITITVLWNEEGNQKSFSLANLRNDPNRKPLDGVISGLIKEQGTSALLSQASVEVVDNLNWNSTTDASGAYSIKVPTGTYQVRASKDGYWVNTSPSLNVSGAVNCDIYLTKMAVGNVTGYVFVNDHIVISKIVSSSETAAGDDFEWVELYNPTTFQWTVDANHFYLYTVKEGDPASLLAPSSNLTVANNTILPYHYYLVANTSTVNTGAFLIDADAYYDDGDRIKEDERGAIFLLTKKPGTISAWYSDMVGWTQPAGDNPGPSGFTYFETSPIKDGNGLDDGKTHIRYSCPNTYSQILGNAFDTYNNSNDFHKNISIGASPDYYPKNSISISTPTSGSPAASAIITSDDSTSSPVTASTTGYFYLPNVATGTWNLGMYYSGMYGYKSFRQVGNVTLLNNGQTVGVSNSTTTPAWPLADRYYTILSSEASTGLVTGYVRSGGVGVSGIKVEAGVYFTYSNAWGGYTIALDPGLYNITANPGNLNSSYTSQYISTVPVNQGQITSNTNFDIAPGGIIAGRVLSNSGDPLPDIYIVAYDNNGNESGITFTQADGRFYLSNCSTSKNNYTIVPTLDSGEISSPSQRIVTVAAGSTKWTDTSGFFSSYTVTSAFGKLAGTVTNNSAAIETGVLIIATTSTITTDPPDINNALIASGSLYYGTVSKSDGTYELEVRGGHTYNVYAWYSTMGGGTTAYSKKQSLGNPVTSGATAPGINFTWP